jgi:uncharacterized protein YecE (DUF72 family)
MSTSNIPKIASRGGLILGTSGYSYSHWKEIFYPKDVPQAKWLSFYAEHFNAVEINATFYRPFAPHVYAKWHDLTPDAFKFVLKGPKSVTRDKRLQDAGEEVASFMDAATSLGNKLSCIIWQLPPSFKLNPETLETTDAFFGSLPRTCRHAVEMRHTSWLDEEFLSLLDRLSIGWVSADSSRFVSETRRTGGFGYIRLHGPGALYSSPYSDEQLQEWANTIRGMEATGDVYCFFNNDFGGYALANGERLRELLQ